MTEQEKEQILRKMKNREQGDVASNDDDLVRSEKFMKKVSTPVQSIRSFTTT